MKEGNGRDCLLVNMERDETEKDRKTKRRKRKKEGNGKGILKNENTQNAVRECQNQKQMK